MIKMRSDSMEEKKYLKWYNKVGYGSGDIAGNVVYAFLTSFVMIYLTDSVGLAAGIVGTLIAVSKLFDGFTDIFFGSMIDKTHSKMGKAKPWMLYGYIGMLFCGSYKLGKYSKICMVLYCIYIVKWCVLYSK
jgi:GPH family glycoside/pentoside/hexuronide:cation symporter